MECKHCNREFEDKKHPDKLFCSKKCAGAARRTITEKTCPVCGKSFRTNGTYCSKDCARESYGWKRGKIVSAYITTCEVCGKQFTTIPSQDAKTCSYQCAGIRSRKDHTRTCKQCGIVFVSKKKNDFCSRSCAGKYRWNIPSSFDYKTSKHAKAILLQRSPICSICGYDKQPGILQIHHKDFNRRNNKEDNVTLLCPNCHEEFHYNSKTGRYKNNIGKVSAA